MTDRRPGDSREGEAGAMLPAWPRALVVIAHPDDESFGLGAVIDRLAAAGAGVHILCYTHGGASTLNQTHADLHRARGTELREAATELGAAGVTLLDYPDGGLAGIPASELAGHVTDAAARAAASGLLVFDDTGVTGHPDHRAATGAAVLAGRRAGLPVLAWTLPAAVAGCRPAPARTSPASRRTGSTCGFASAGTGSGGRRCCMPARSRPAPCCGGGCGCWETASTCAGSYRQRPRSRHRLGGEH